jgi:hypothetical protein
MGRRRSSLITISFSKERRLRSPTLILIWGYCSQDLALVCGMHFNPESARAMGSLALLERQCFRNHFQDISSKMSLMDTLVRPTVLYGSEVWGPGLLESDWSSTERVQIILLRCIIRCKQTSSSAHCPRRVWCSPLST